MSLVKSFDIAQSVNFEKKSKTKFETAYFLAKEELPNSKFKKDMRWKLNMVCNLVKHTLNFFYKQLGSGLSPERCLNFQTPFCRHLSRKP